MTKIGGLSAALMTLLMVATVGLAPSAHAATNKMEGRSETDSSAIIRWTNVLKKDEIRKIRDVRLRKVLFSCDDGSTFRTRGRVVGEVKVDQASRSAAAPIKHKGKGDLLFALGFDDSRGDTGGGSIQGELIKGDRTCTPFGGTFSIRRR